MKHLQSKNHVGWPWMEDIIHPPFWWLFNASAMIHDQNYSDGGNKEDRFKADLGFFWRILQDANQIDCYVSKKKAVYTAILYFILVRVFGWLGYRFK